MNLKGICCEDSVLMRNLKLYFDGGNARGIATWAVLVKENEKVIAKLTGLVDPVLPQTNNVAEWIALYMAVIYASAQLANVYRFEIFGDSELVIKQITGEYVVSNTNLKPIYQKTMDVLLGLGLTHYITFRWIPREENTEVDALGRILR